MSMYEEYKESFVEDIQSILEMAKCQPILFIGSGFSQRYANYPNWENLLVNLSENCPNCKPYSYYKQSNKDNHPKTGQDLTNSYFDWAYEKGNSFFDSELFSSSDKGIFVKSQIASLFHSFDSSLENLNSQLSNELKLLQKIKPHAIITTNYDNLLEIIFPEYEVIIGNDVFRKQQLSIGEIFKIHGCITNPESLVFNENDYIKFQEKNAYLSAKLLTYFVEHPLIFIGYSAQDQNIKKILFDVHSMVQAQYELIPNIYFLDWQDSLNSESSPPSEKEIPISTESYMKIKSISASDFSWVFESFESQGALENINIKTLRAFMARCHKLVISSIPTKTINLNYNHINKAISSDEEFFNFFGFGNIDNPEHLNANYPYTITKIGEILGGLSVHKINQIIKIINDKHGVDIKKSDNVYHLLIKTGKAEGSKARKYSEKMVQILQNEISGTTYSLEI